MDEVVYYAVCPICGCVVELVQHENDNERYRTEIHRQPGLTTYPPLVCPGSASLNWTLADNQER